MNGLKIQFGTGGNPISGWINTDLPEVDIRKPLPYENSSASYIYASHLIEHVTLAEAYRFLKECRRVMEPMSVLRLVFPDVCRIEAKADQQYLEWLEQSGFGPATKENAVANILLGHGHQHAWTLEAMIAILSSLGFRAYRQSAGKSDYPPLNGIDRHWTVIGHHADNIESVCVEAVKP